MTIAKRGDQQPIGCAQAQLSKVRSMDSSLVTTAKGLRLLHRGVPVNLLQAPMSQTATSSVTGSYHISFGDTTGSRLSHHRTWCHSAHV